MFGRVGQGEETSGSRDKERAIRTDKRARRRRRYRRDEVTLGDVGSIRGQLGRRGVVNVAGGSFDARGGGGFGWAPALAWALGRWGAGALGCTCLCCSTAAPDLGRLLWLWTYGNLATE